MPAPAEVATGPTDVRGAASLLSALGSEGLVSHELGRTKKEPEAEEAEEPEAPEEETEASGEDRDAAPDEETEEEPEEGDADDVPEDATIAVKVGGKTEKVSLKELKSGYSRTKDYTQKTQELAETRKANEAQLTAVQQERTQLKAALDKVKASLEAQAPKRPDPADYTANPQEFVFQEAMWNRHREQTQQLEAAQQELMQRQFADHQKVMAEQTKAGQKVLMEKIPTWKDPKVATKEQAGMRDFAKEHLNYTDDELDQITDPRAVLALRSAWQGHQVLNKKAPLIPDVKKPDTPTLKPGGQPEGQTTRQKQALNRLAQTGKVTDAAAALKGLF